MLFTIKNMRSRQKPCAQCQQVEPVLYRVQHDESGKWVFVCRRCWDEVSHNNPFYTYGGTWKAKKTE
ncbi:hypothetical protein [Oscillatoria sp. FACHB-1407]|uniref:hypothetical protein n=2 Tax=Oscillatoria sp. FACHB-1407 TaxID=2692847 RepID=UPI001F54CF61|nr:hypothetical protein [Oscillatoria sp. FACHB-1407]